MRSDLTRRPLAGLVNAAVVLIAGLVVAPLVGVADGASPAGDSLGGTHLGTTQDGQPDVFQRIS